MGITSRRKRVTEPLCSPERARLIGGSQTPASSSSNWSEHEAATCLSHLVQAFLETSSDHDEPNCQDSVRDESNGGSDSNIGYTDQGAEIKELLDPGWQIDPFRIRLALEVKNAIEAERAKLWEKEKPGLFRRVLAGRLCKLGYDSGICKLSWQTSGSVTAGSYEYIDVVVKKDRYIIDPDFASGLKVARATDEYNRIVAAVPDVVVARAESVGRTVRIVAEAARQSLRQQGMHVPPWRKTRYMLAKWAGPYKRTSAASLSVPAPVPLPHEVTCRTAPVLGFQVVQAGRTR